MVAFWKMTHLFFRLLMEAIFGEKFFRRSTRSTSDLHQPLRTADLRNAAACSAEDSLVIFKIQKRTPKVVNEIPKSFQLNWTVIGQSIAKQMP